MRISDWSSDVCSSDLTTGGSWDPVDEEGRPLTPLPTPESKRPALASVYAINKYVQERMTLTLTAAYGMEGVALRLWNVYGPGQALSNPYTGVLAIFASRLASGHSPLVFEDRSEEHTSELQSLMRISYAVFCLKKKR